MSSLQPPQTQVPIRRYKLNPALGRVTVSTIEDLGKNEESILKVPFTFSYKFTANS